MKKKLLTIMTLLCAFASAQADDAKTSWDFTAISETTLENLSADETNWKYVNSAGSHSYQNKNAIGSINNKVATCVELSANNASISETAGLLFYAKNEGNLLINPNFIHLNSKNDTVLISGVGVGKIVTIDYETSNNTYAASIGLKNATILNSTSDESSTKRVKVSAIVTTENSTLASDVKFGFSRGVYLYSINISENTYNNIPENVSIGINSYGRQTYSSEYPLDFSNTGVDAYIATSADADKATVTLTKVTTVPPSTGVILKTDTKKGEKDVTIPVVGVAETVETNLLVAAAKGATVPASTTGAYTYIYGYDKSASDIASTIGFYQCTSDYTLTTTATGTEGRAYLLTTDDLLASGDGAKFVTMDFGDGETTGISNVKVTKVDDDAYYTLSGVKVAQPRKGLYIKNGKKVIVK